MMQLREESPSANADFEIPVDDSAAMDWLFRRGRHPYYIVTARYVRTSAGIKALHLLCHALNGIGERAYIITYPSYPPEFSVNPKLVTPLLTYGVVRSDFDRRLCPITVYPEIVQGNSFGAPFVVRYVLNFPGLLGGDAEYPETELCVGYSESITKAVPRARATLFIPASDPLIFTPYPCVRREGTCFYAGKFKYFHGGKLLDITKDSTEITRHRSDSQTAEQIAEIFRRSELFYCYENSALAIEAVLCGCPVVFLPNKYFDQVIAVQELGWDGMAWGPDPQEIERAKSTVDKGRLNYLRLYALFREQLSNFVDLTQNEAGKHLYHQPMVIPYLKPPGWQAKFQLAKEVYKFQIHQNGIGRATWKIIQRILQRGFRIAP